MPVFDEHPEGLRREGKLRAYLGVAVLDDRSVKINSDGHGNKFNLNLNDNINETLTLTITINLTLKGKLYWV